jgi:hypothetical protein
MPRFLQYNLEGGGEVVKALLVFLEQAFRVDLQVVQDGPETWAGLLEDGA